MPKHKEISLPENQNPFPTKSRNFANVVEKIQSSNLGNDSAWAEAQPLLQHYVEDYPEKYTDYLNDIRKLFNLRRNAFQGKEKEESLKQVKTLVSSFEDSQIDDLSIVLVYIRDIFDIKARDRRLMPKTSQ